MAGFEWRIMHTSGLVSERPVRLKQVVATFSAVPTGTLDLRDGVSASAPARFSVSHGFGGTVSVSLEEPMTFGTGMYVSMPGECVMCALLIDAGEDV